MEEPPVTSQEERDAKQNQNNLIAESCNLIIAQSTTQPFKSYEDAINKLNAYHVRSV